MAMAPISSTAGYCTGAQAVTFFDVRAWAQLIQDDGDAVADAAVPTHPTLLAELLAASGEVEESVMRGGRYKPVDLAALQASTTSGGTYLAKMTASIAMWNMMERRDPEAQMTSKLARIYESLILLSRGELVFGFQEVMDAGVSATVKWYQTQADLDNDPVWQARRMFGNRNIVMN